jgi:hypothetical protein
MKDQSGTGSTASSADASDGFGPNPTRHGFLRGMAPAGGGLMASATSSFGATPTSTAAGSMAGATASGSGATPSRTMRGMYVMVTDLIVQA